MAVRTMGSPDAPVAEQFRYEYADEKGEVPIDQVEKHRRERAQRADPRETFGEAPVTIQAGGAKHTLTIRYAQGGSFAFAVYSRNPDWFDQSEQDWRSAARNGLVKFAAERGLNIIDGPKPEVLNQYNLMIQTQEIIR